MCKSWSWTRTSWSCAWQPGNWPHSYSDAFVGSDAGRMNKNWSLSSAHHKFDNHLYSWHRSHVWRLLCKPSCFIWTPSWQKPIEQNICMSRLPVLPCLLSIFVQNVVQWFPVVVHLIAIINYIHCSTQSSNTHNSKKRHPFTKRWIPIILLGAPLSLSLHPPFPLHSVAYFLTLPSKKKKRCEKKKFRLGQFQTAASLSQMVANNGWSSLTTAQYIYIPDEASL